MMKINIYKIVFFISLILFVISLFLPAYYGELGYNCAKFCLLEIWTLSEGLLAPLYYIPFNITNMMMILIPIIILSGLYHQMSNQKTRLLLKYVSTFLCLHVISWPIMHFAYGEFQHIQIGYYLWAISISVFVITIWKYNDLATFTQSNR